MASFKSNPVGINAGAERVFLKLSDLSSLRELLENVPKDSIPADKMAMFEQMEITPDSITIPGGPVGAIKLVVAERVNPTLIKLEGEGTPVALNLMLHIAPLGEERSEASVEIDVAIPAMLKPMVAKPLQQIVDQFAMVLQAIPF